jgi:excisionase family DNA binding protein
MQEEILLTVTQTARILQVSERTVVNYITRGELPAFRVGLRGYRISPSDLQAFIEKRKHPPDKDL